MSLKTFIKNEADKKTLLSVWWWIKYVMFTAFIVNYFDILYGGYLWLAFVIAASICNAIMDTLSHHFSTSIFKKLNPTFWNAEISWKNKYIGRNPENGLKSIFRYPMQIFYSDAWHLFKSCMIIFLGLSAVISLTSPNEWYWDLFLFGWFWNITFSIFYNKILR